MSGEFEAVADIATGVLAANAIEGAGAADHADHAGHGGKCLNCGTALTGPYCHGCGQSAHIHRTASALFHDIAHGVFHFEGRTWHTLPLLFWRPGELTRRYVHGERVKFVSPMTLLLLSVFLMAAAFGSLGGPVGSKHGIKTAASLAQARTEAAEEVARIDTKIATLQGKRKQAAAEGGNVGKIDRKIGALESEQASVEKIASGKAMPKIENDRFVIDEKEFATGVPGIDSVIRHAAENPELAAYKLQSSAYKFSWALIPISLPFIWLPFAFRRDVGIYDHAVFATYSLSAMTLMVVVLSVASALDLWEALIWMVLLIFPPWHMYRQLKGAYQLSRWGAWWRMWMLIFTAYTSALIFFILLITLGILE